MMNARRICGAWGLAVALATATAADDSIVNSAHDLSARGPGPIRAVNETRICIFCHTPHNAAPQTPLWNRENPRTHYRIYESSTIDARIDQPSGPSKMCLSCHDGSLALGNVLSSPTPHPIVMTARTIPPGTKDLTNDLSDDHPIGFRYDRALANADRQIRPPEVISGELPLGSHGEVHCTTCHDPHNNELGSFLRISDRRATICVTCHKMIGWELASHATSPKRTPGRVVDPTERLKYDTLTDNGCLSCHKIHSAPNRERLLRATREEDGCLNCHDGSVARFNIAGRVNRRFGHNVAARTGVHDAAEIPLTMRRHVECADCHNPHAAHRTTSLATAGGFGKRVAGPVAHVSGVEITGRETRDAQFLHEICFKCHGDNPGHRRPVVDRQLVQRNTRLEFQTSNPSFHPVAGARRNPDVVSLIPPLRSGSVITCTDCHNSEDARSFGGTGPNGPHGSRFEPLLVRNYDTDDFTVESENAYALCYGCHSRDSILNNESFSLHRFHVVAMQAPCSVCHDAHGVYRGQGSATNHSSLINFDVSVVSPAETVRGSRIAYEDTGRLAGNCTLVCHGRPHIQFPYANTSRRGSSSAKASAFGRSQIGGRR